jgi:hypothetical protein
MCLDKMCYTVCIYDQGNRDWQVTCHMRRMGCALARDQIGTKNYSLLPVPINLYWEITTVKP